MPRFALLSVSDKRGLVPFAQGLVARGFTLLSTGGTARALVAAGIPVVKVSDHTGAPEIFDGRVKTLHPKIHGGILGRRGVDDAVASQHGIDFIDVVAVNLYPFEATVSGGASLPDAIEQIDIGGPAMVRASAKNHASVFVVVDPGDYDAVLDAIGENGDAPHAATVRGRLAVKAFRHTATYDAVVSAWLAERLDAAEPNELA
ncbi:MAG: bifunctional phosphoribosylaminoimidazolecarboxamide formyltransferase/IMP cyclohydrolase, partial [Myxococcota bacterium]